ncbi:MAG TPA: glycosyltransferase [Prolixibacteraceae bacterium]|nr:glycosyltransferase [Prolixibacteraceae bacterium]
MDKELPIDFVFGDKYLDVKKMDYSLLRNFKKEVKNRVFIRKPIYYQTGVLRLLKENYTTYLMLGEIYCLSTWLMLFRLKFSRKKIYLWSHGWYGRESLIKIIIKKIFFNLADGTFLYGNYSRQLMIKKGLIESKLFVIYNSLSYDEQIEIRKKLTTSSIYQDHFKNDFHNLIFIGRLTEIKRLDLLLNAIANLKAQSINVNLTIIGDGTMKEELKICTQQLKLERVWFYGACYNEQVLSELIYNADLCVSPGNVGLTAIHAMVFGTPVLTHNNFPFQMPEFEAIEDGVTGKFFDYGDSDSLAENIKIWFIMAPERENVRQKCYEVIDTKYNPHVQLQTFIKYLN